MERINIIENELDKKKETHFIGSWNIKNDNLCKEIIRFFDENKGLQKNGTTTSGTNYTSKKTTDISINPNELKNDKYKCFNSYIDELYKCFIDYQLQWPFLKSMVKNVDIGIFNVQKYSKGDHFSQIHTERSDLKSSNRLFAWMTYLDSVEDGGTTNFLHYGIKIKPEIGKTLIWPAEWTHAHSGEILGNGEKHIITGWMNFPYSM